MVGAEMFQSCDTSTHPIVVFYSHCIIIRETHQKLRIGWENHQN